VRKVWRRARQRQPPLPGPARAVFAMAPARGPAFLPESLGRAGGPICGANGSPASPTSAPPRAAQSPNVFIETCACCSRAAQCGLGALSAERRQPSRFLIFSALSFVFGAAFLVIESMEFSGMVSKGAGPSRSLSFRLLYLGGSVRDLSPVIDSMLADPTFTARISTERSTLPPSRSPAIQ
jgi:hypothetical protein